MSDMSGLLRGSFPHDKNAHEEDHSEEYPHKKTVHHLSNLLPLSHFDAGGPLLTETIGDVFHITNQLGVVPREEPSISIVVVTAE